MARLMRFGALTLGSTAILMAVAAVLALGVAAITNLPLIALLLAYAPSNITKMDLIALAINTDPAFITIWYARHPSQHCVPQSLAG